MSACAQCGLQITWVNEGTKKRPKWQAFDPDGSVHWDRCSAARFERIKREGTFFAEPTAEGYVTRERIQFTMLRPETPGVGKSYVPDGCTCGLPPWDLCKPDCEHAIKPKGRST